MPSKEEVIEAAMLARMVGGHLASVDQMTIERSNNPANKISMQNFVAPLVGKESQRPNIENAPREMVKAYEGLNELALRTVPDPFNEGRPPNSQEIHQLPQQQIKMPQQIPQRNVQQVDEVRQSPKQEFSNLLTRSDIDSIRNSLKNIDKSLSSMLLFLTKNEVKNK